MTSSQKKEAIKSLKVAEKELEAALLKSNGKKVKHTTEVLLKQALTELELKRKEVAVKNRELAIESALERVRSRFMAMHASHELIEVVRLVGKEVRDLGIHVEAMQLVTDFSEPKKGLNIWIAVEGIPILSKFHVPRLDILFVKNFFQAIKQRRAFYTEKYSRAEKNKSYKFLYKHTDFKFIPKERQQVTLDIPAGVIRSSAINKNSVIAFQRFGSEAFTEEENAILKRFGNSFEQSYTRFLDLQKAEAQAREAQIEVALERVRAKAMAMNTSDDLKDVALELRRQMGSLGLEELETCAIHLYEGSGEYFTSWAALKSPKSASDIILTEAHLPRKGVRNLEKIIDYYKRGKRDYLVENDWKNFKEFSQALKTHAPEARKVVLKTIRNRKKNEIQSYWSVSDFKGGSLLMATITMPEEDSRNLLRRFANVFDLAYQRFADLKKAEAQAREARIEVALERVRARSMAMHQSDELSDCAELLFRELSTLGGSLWTSGFAILEDDDNVEGEYRTTDSGGTREDVTFIPNKGDRTMQFLYEGWKRGQTYLKYDLGGKEIKAHYKNMLALPRGGHVFQAVLDAGSRFPDRQQMHAAYFKHGYLLVISLDNYNESELLVRFAKVFEQTYTRFLDLQKAEAQARESEIQLALERVRARTMAMQKSEELSETALLMHQQFRTLTRLPEKVRMVISILREDARLFDLYITSTDGTKLDTKYSYSIDDPYVFQPAYQAVKNKKPSFIIELSGNPLKEYLAFMESQSYPVTFRERVVITSATFSNGYFCLVTADSASNEKLELLGRFAKVFEQTYTRFLDLQKSEAQAREAQIQLALERVRARTMAMQSSDELAQVSFLLNKQVVELGIPTRGCAFNIYNEHDSTEWFSSLEGTLPTYKTPREKIFLKYYEAGHRGETLLIEEFGGKRIKDHYQYLFKVGIFGKDVTQEIIKEITPEFQIDHVAYFKYGYLLFITLVPAPAAHDVFRRFAKEFEQTYTRFLDLQKAEEQGKEAQIEASLERVRAQAMAMHHSDDLSKTIRVYFEQLDNLLNANVIRCGAGLLNKENTMAVMSTASRKPDGEIYDVKGVIDMKGHPLLENTYKHWLTQKEYSHVLTGNQIKEYYQYITNQVAIPDNKGKDHLHFYFPMFTEGSFYVVTDNALNESDLQIFRRFSSALSLTYRRFNDLQKAEAQAREAQIEAALERVRSLTMAMHSSEDVGNCIVKMFDELTRLGVDEGTRFGIGILNRANENNQLWTARKYGNEVKLHIGNLDMTLHPLLISARKAWKEQVPLHQYVLQGDDLLHYYEMLNTARDYKIKIAIEKLPDKEFHYGFIFEHGFFYAFSPCEFQPSLIQTAQRFSALFEQTYRRYLDLQKAEAQAREALIEVALEKVRSRSLAMHKAEELGEVVTVVLEKLRELDIPVNDGVALVTHIEGSKDQIEWMENPGYAAALKVYQPYYDHPILVDYWKAKEKGLDFIAPRYTAKQNRSFLKHIFEHTDFKHVPQEIKDYCLAAKTYSYSAAIQKNSSIFINDYSGRSLSEHEIEIVKRFSKVFEQAYTRFLDLQKVEAQAREAQIEASLERVRSRSMAMHKSDELLDVIAVVSKQLSQLGFRYDNVSFAVNSESDDYSFWTYFGGLDKTAYIHVPYINNPMYQRMHKVFEAGNDFYEDVVATEDNRAWIKHMFAHNELNFVPQEIREYLLKSSFTRSIALTPRIMLILGNYASKPYSEDQNKILKRFAAVFDQSYVRFLDLKKAEEQAREAQIEAALERIRSRSMAMHKSDELAEVSGVLYQELVKLGLTGFVNCGFVVIDEKRSDQEGWTTTPDGGKVESYFLPLTGDEIFDKRYEAWKAQVPVFIQRLGGEQLKKHMELALPTLGSKQAEQIARENFPDPTIFYCCNFRQGYLCIVTGKTFSQEYEPVLVRFSKVFEQTYTRFLDLQKAEASAKLAIKQSSLDRVRAEIASMRAAKDLERITPLIWKELIALDVPFIRCGVFIMDDQERVIHNFLSTPDGKAIATFQLPYDTPGFVTDILKHWQIKKKFVDHWDEPAMIDFANILVTRGIFTTPEQYLKTLPKEGFYLHFLPFLQGMLYVGNLSQLENESLDLLQSLADSFSTAYSRYDDFNKLESAKRQVDKTLVDLKQAQQQLVQSEKMASLGELTAGIAHEIQNPLNFVNNFSELNKELLTEMEEAIRQNDFDEVTAIARNIANNQEKINLHGKRAEGIVKGMLQHSRSSSGQKELTDINALCDEYLRLSYHGYRAKDKSFNSKFETEFEPMLPRLSVISQDIGRVVLNLINNAFYAVSERAKKETSVYEPYVLVSTKNLGDKIEISVKDNGNGIPDSIKEKIFQPFFTTKPTGQGTGLGLSLSYDIVKAHGGTIDVVGTDTGSDFRITIPLTQ